MAYSYRHGYEWHYTYSFVGTKEEKNNTFDLHNRMKAFAQGYQTNLASTTVYTPSGTDEPALGNLKLDVHVEKKPGEKPEASITFGTGWNNLGDVIKRNRVFPYEKNVSDYADDDAELYPFGGCVGADGFSMPLTLRNVESTAEEVPPDLYLVKLRFTLVCLDPKNNAPYELGGNFSVKCGKNDDGSGDVKFKLDDRMTETWYKSASDASSSGKSPAAPGSWMSRMLGFGSSPKNTESPRSPALTRRQKSNDQSEADPNSWRASFGLAGGKSARTRKSAKSRRRRGRPSSRRQRKPRTHRKRNPRRAKRSKRSRR